MIQKIKHSPPLSGFFNGWSMSDWKPCIEERYRNSISDIAVGNAWINVQDNQRPVFDSIDDLFVRFVVDGEIMGVTIEQFLMWNKLDDSE